MERRFLVTLVNWSEICPALKDLGLVDRCLGHKPSYDELKSAFIALKEGDAGHFGKVLSSVAARAAMGLSP
jgi:hypothetical protein